MLKYVWGGGSYQVLGGSVLWLWGSGGPYQPPYTGVCNSQRTRLSSDNHGSESAMPPNECERSKRARLAVTETKISRGPHIIVHYYYFVSIFEAKQ
jgi:hypothetical protein